MPQSLSNVLVHLIFSTKERQRWIQPDVRPRLHAYTTGILKRLNSPLIAINSVEDHVHILFALSRTETIANVVEKVKSNSSRWIKRDGGVCPQFRWQGGYRAFSIGQSQVSTVKQYIANQVEHHLKMTFQEEYRSFLKRYNVPYDERYVWD